MESSSPSISSAAEFSELYNEVYHSPSEGEQLTKSHTRNLFGGNKAKQSQESMVPKSEKTKGGYGSYQSTSSENMIMGWLLGGFVGAGATVLSAMFASDRHEQNREDLQDYHDQTSERATTYFREKYAEHKLFVKKKYEAMLCCSEYVWQQDFKMFHMPLLALAEVYEGELIHTINVLIVNIDRMLTLYVQHKRKNISTMRDHDTTLVKQYNTVISLCVNMLLESMFNDQHRRIILENLLWEENATRRMQMAEKKVKLIRQALSIIQSQCDSFSMLLISYLSGKASELNLVNLPAVGKKSSS